MKKIISIIVPAYNEEKNLMNTYLELTSLLKRTKKYKLKIIFINDGSSDNSSDILKKIKNKDNRVSIINMKINYGAWVGFRVALKNFDCDYALSFPADLQIPVSLIEKFMDEIEKNKHLDVVYGEGYPHGNGIPSTFFWFWLFLRFHKKFFNKQVDTFLINKKIINYLKKNKKFHNVVPYGIFKTKKYAFVRFKKNPRRYGKSKYNLMASINMFSKTILLSVNTNLLSYKKPKYKIF